MSNANRRGTSLPPITTPETSARLRTWPCQVVVTRQVVWPCEASCVTRARSAVRASTLMPLTTWGWDISTKKVEQLKKRFVEGGFEAALYRKPVTNAHRRKITGDEEAHLIALCCSQAPEGQERWTLRMLADKMVELDVIASVSHETIRRT